jgi:hypothetical protein
MWHEWGKRNIYRDFVQKPEGKSHLEELAKDRKIILKYTLMK